MKILSISDLITNSSSEVFCYITGDENDLEEIYNTLYSIFGYNQEYEITPCVSAESCDDEKYDRVVIELPYHLLSNKYKEYYFRGAIDNLVSHFECKVEYNNEEL